MARQKQGESPADFIRRMGWKVGATLRGSKTSFELGFTIVLTAIGRNCVLGLDEEHEGNMDFGCRQWRRVKK